MERYVATKYSAYEYKTTSDDEKRSFVRHASKYMFIYEHDYAIILIDFQINKYRSVYNQKFINELTKTYNNAVTLLKPIYSIPKAIVLSDTHLNIVQLLFPFMYAGYIERIDTSFKLIFNHITSSKIIHLGDYTISNISRVYKEHMDQIKPYCILTTKILKQLIPYGLFLAGNHDWFIAQKLPLTHHRVERIGDKTYLFIHGPPLMNDMPENKYQFKDKMFFRINRNQNNAWNKERVDKCFKSMTDKLLTKIDIIVCGHEQSLSIIDLPDDIDALLTQYSLPKKDFVCLDCPSSTRGYFAFESDEIDHPYLLIERRSDL